MANTVYPKALEGFGDGSIIWTTDDCRVMLVKTGGAYNPANTVLDDIVASDNGRSAAIGSKSSTLGVFDGADTSLVATAALLSVALVIYKYNASDTLARLIAWIDTATGLSFTPAAGQTVTIAWDNGTNKIFKIG